MNILSKTTALEESISNMEASLKRLGAYYKFSCYKHPLEYCYSVNISSKEAPKHIYANGKGTLKEASIASALGEYIERLQTNMFFADFYLPNFTYYPDQKVFDFDDDTYLNPKLKSIYNPKDELIEDDLIDFNSDFEDKIVSIPFTNISNQDSVYFPVNILNTLYLSNGLASGNTPKEAQVQALSEIFERYVKFQIIKHSYSLPKYPKDKLLAFTKLNNNIQTLENGGYIIDVLDASLGGQFPVTAISLINPKTSTLFISFGSHPILEVALDRTMTELMQGRDLNKLDDFEMPTFDEDTIKDDSNLESHYIDSNGKLSFDILSLKHTFPYSSWSYNGTNCDDEYRYLVDILDTLQKDIFIREYDYLGFYSCQIIVPEFSEVYPIDDLIYNNKNRAKQIRQMILNYHDFDYTEILDILNQHEDSLKVGAYIGVIFENEFTVGEFKAHLHLLNNDLQEAQYLLQNNPNKMFILISELINMYTQNKKLDNYKDVLSKIFSEEILSNAIDIISGKKPLINLKLSKEYKNILKLYQKLNDKKLNF